MKFLKNKILFLYISIIFTIFFLFIYKFNSLRIQSDNKITQKIEILDNEIEKGLIDLSSILKNNHDSIFFHLKYFKNIYKHTDYFIFYNNKLLFWTTNRLNHDELLDTKSNEVKVLSNGWYRIKKEIFENYIFIGIYLIKNHYSIQNDFLKNRFNPFLELPDHYEILLDENSGIAIYNKEGQYLFSLIEGKKPIRSKNQDIIELFFLLILILLMVELINHLSIKFTNKFIKIIYFLFFTILILFIIHKFIPLFFNDNFLFSPFIYSYSDFLPSLGHLFIYSFILFYISLKVSNLHIKDNENLKNPGEFKSYLFSTILIIISNLIFYFIFKIFESLFLNSQIPFNFNDILSFNILSLIFLLIIIFNLFSFSYFIFLFIKILINSKNIIIYSFILNLSILTFSIFYSIYFKENLLFIIFSGLLFIGSIIILKIEKISIDSVEKIIIIFLVFSFFISLHYLIINNNSEKSNRLFIAKTFSIQNRKPILEFQFSKVISNYMNDTTLFNVILSSFEENNNFIKLERYLTENYLQDHWINYLFHISPCFENESLLIKFDNIDSIVDCTDFFKNLLSKYRNITIIPEQFYFLNYGVDNYTYLVIFKFDKIILNSDKDFYIFVEIFPKFIGYDFGFPALLYEGKPENIMDISEYSYGIYFKNNLQRKVGNFSYPLNLNSFNIKFIDESFFDYENYNHLFYKIDENYSLIISKQKKGFIEIIAPFSFIFISFVLLYFLFSVFLIFRKKYFQSFNRKIQIYILLIIIVSFLISGIFIINYQRNLYINKNYNLLKEKTYSVLSELQNKFLYIDNFSKNEITFLNQFLEDLSNIFFTDINIYDTTGNLIGTSRPQIFEANLISRKIDPFAFKELTFKSSSVFIHNEQIGDQIFLSSYLPFINYRNNTIAYLNLPYFAKETDLKKELSVFLSGFISIYFILIAFSIVVALIIINVLSRPLRAIVNKLSKVDLSGHNEKLEWNYDDEIGQLVDSYNKMIDHLAKSAEILRKSERESAWREMAKQIAHEIKNPLTPMKLSIQHLKSAWENKAPDWEERLQKFTNTMIEQINALSIIASEFYDFSNLSDGNRELVNIYEALSHSVELFSSQSKLHFLKTSESTEKIFVYADKSQLIRAFNNLIKNALQAVSDRENGEVIVQCKKEEKYCLVIISDNGPGIPEEISEKIFSPYFTTKSSGIGLGLAIVKNIISSVGGEIYYESDSLHGTTFYVKLPIAEDTN